MFAERRQRILDQMGPDAVAILIGAELRTRSNDTEFPFRQDSDFWYVTGFDHPAAVAVLRTDDGPAFTLFVQPRDRAAEVWTGYRPGVEGAKEIYQADESFDIAKLEEELPVILERAARVYHVFGRSERIDRVVTRAQESLRQRTKAGVAPASAFCDPRDILHELRLFKDDAELAIMRRAAAISSEGHQAAARLARAGRYEYELEAALGHVFRSRGGSGPAYNTIVGGGANAAILHYIRNDQALVAGQLVLIDAGVELEGYASDVTRVYPVDGRYAGAPAAIYDVVLEAQEHALSLCGPGTTLRAIHEATVRKLTEGLVALGLLAGDVDELVASEAFRPFYMHGTSHWLGLDVHDCGTYAHGEVQRKLEPGMVFTVEPGLYIAADAEGDFPDEFRGVGVRIEDDVVIHAHGHENLNTAIPKNRTEIEAWMRGA